MEKVLHGLSSCGNDYGTPNICEVTECPYREAEAFCVHGLAHDAMMLISELLKAQEPISVKRIDGKRNHFLECGSCNANLMSGMKFCPQCGRAVKWDG